jgi:hypothetical protein
MKKTIIALVFVLLVGWIADAQQLTPAPTFQLINSGYGAAALGMGGAYAAVAGDLSALYWNPAGIAQSTELQLYVDYRFQGDSFEDFSEVSTPNRLQSVQRFKPSGHQLDAIALSFPIETKSYVFTPAFAYQRSTKFNPERAMKDVAGVITHLPGDVTYQSEGKLDQTFGSESEYVFSVSAKVTKKVYIGGNWSFLAGSPETTLSGDLTDTTIAPGGTQTRSYHLDETTKQSVSGNYLNVGLLLVPKPGIRFGADVRFPYTHTEDLNVLKKMTSDAGTTEVSATAKAETDIPLQWTLGFSMQTQAAFIVAMSVTSADWSSSALTISHSNNTAILPEVSLPYPTLRIGTAPQISLLQWRLGTQYTLGHTGEYGIQIRGGYFRDGQPYGNISSNRVWFNGFSFGAGYKARGYAFDMAFVSENGEMIFTPQDYDRSSFKNRRWVFGLTITS